MVNLIKAELYKLSKSGVIKLFLVVTMLYIVMRSFDIKDRLFSSLNITSEATSTKTVGYSALFLLEYSGIFTFFIPFMIVSIFGLDFGRGIVGNLFGHGIKRSTIFVSKYIVFSVAVLVMQFSASAVNVGLCSLLNGWGTSFEFKQIIDLLFLTLNCSLMHIATGSATILLALILRSEALVVISFFALSIIESVVASILRIGGNNSVFFATIAKLFESNYSAGLFVLPTDGNLIHYMYLSVFINVGLSICIGILICKKRELK